MSIAKVKAITIGCSLCGEEGSISACPLSQLEDKLTDVNYVQGRQQNNPYLNTYNLGWRKHSNFSWSENSNLLNLGMCKAPLGFQVQPKQQESQQRRPVIKDELRGYIADSIEISKRTEANIGTLRNQFDNLTASVRVLETQVGQIAQSLETLTCPQGNLALSTKSNPRDKNEQAFAVTLRSKKELNKVSSKEKVAKEEGVPEGEKVIVKNEGYDRQPIDRRRKSKKKVVDKEIKYPSLPFLERIY